MASLVKGRRSVQRAARGKPDGPAITYVGQRWPQSRFHLDESMKGISLRPVLSSFLTFFWRQGQKKPNSVISHKFEEFNVNTDPVVLLGRSRAAGRVAACPGAACLSTAPERGPTSLPSKNRSVFGERPSTRSRVETLSPHTHLSHTLRRCTLVVQQ